MPMKENHWTETQEKTNTAGISFLIATFRLGGRTLFHASLWPIIIFYWLACPKARQASMHYLKHIAQARCQKVLLPLESLKHIWRFADTILDKLLAVSGFFSSKDLAVYGLNDLLQDQRGAILITAHTGCLELCQFIGEAELQKNDETKKRLVYVLTHTTHAARFTNIIATLNPKFAVRHIQVSEVGPQTAVQLSEFIEAGHWVVIVADRTPIGSNASLCIPFLGEKAPVALGPFLLAVLLKCPAWSMICTRQTDPQNHARYRVDFTRLFNGTSVNRSQRHDVLHSMAQAWIQTLQSALLKSPLDWFNFFDFWHPTQSKQSRQTRSRSQN